MPECTYCGEGVDKLDRVKPSVGRQDYRLTSVPACPDCFNTLSGYVRATLQGGPDTSPSHAVDAGTHC